MSFVLKTLGAGVLFVLLAIGAAVADIAVNNGRIFFGMMVVRLGQATTDYRTTSKR